MSFSKYADNPVIPAVADQPNTRDRRLPFSNDEGAHWVMALAAAHEIWSLHLEQLAFLGHEPTWSAGSAHGRVAGMPRPVRVGGDDGTTHWVLIASVSDGAVAPGGGGVARLGQFDGMHFTPDSEIRRVDHGAAFYAVQSWNSVPDGRRIWIGWMGSWANQGATTTTAEWRGQMSLPRQLTLCSSGSDHFLAQQPIREIELLRSEGQVRRSVTIGADGDRPDATGVALDVVLSDIDLADGALQVVCTRPDDEEVVVTYHQRERWVSLTVRRSGTHYRCELPAAAGERSLRIVLDVSSVELFCGSGTITDLLPRHEQPWSIELKSSGPTARIGSVGVYALRRPSEATKTEQT